MLDEWEKLILNFYDRPERVTDRDLARLRRSCRSGAGLLCRLVSEQNRRGLLRKPMGTLPATLSGPSGYFPERYRRISDYPKKDVSARLF